MRKGSKPPGRRPSAKSADHPPRFVSAITFSRAPLYGASFGGLALGRRTGGGAVARLRRCRLGKRRCDAGRGKRRRATWKQWERSSPLLTRRSGRGQLPAWWWRAVTSAANIVAHNFRGLIQQHTRTGNVQTPCVDARAPGRVGIAQRATLSVSTLSQGGLPLVASTTTSMPLASGRVIDGRPVVTAVPVRTKSRCSVAREFASVTEGDGQARLGSAGWFLSVPSSL
jgi:hypothetical protein